MYFQFFPSKVAILFYEQDMVREAKDFSNLRTPKVKKRTNQTKEQRTRKMITQEVAKATHKSVKCHELKKYVQI